MDANQYVLAHGMRRTRSILEGWGENPWPVLRTWFVGAVLIALGLLCAVTLAASVLQPDYGFHYGPTAHGGASPDLVLGVLGRNSLVLALHAFACVAGFIAGATLPSRRPRVRLQAHDPREEAGSPSPARVTCFALHADDRPRPGRLTPPGPQARSHCRPHRLPTPCRVDRHLPAAGRVTTPAERASGTSSSPRPVTVALAIPMLIVAATWGSRAWPHISTRHSPRDPLGPHPAEPAPDQLVDLAVLRRLVPAPADDLRAVPDATARGGRSDSTTSSGRSAPHRGRDSPSGSIT
jgi:hypothetical protein